MIFSQPKHRKFKFEDSFNMKEIEKLINEYPKIESIFESMKDSIPLTLDQGMELYTDHPLTVVSALANHHRNQLHGDHTFYNKNIHIEPTNKCAYSCKFCSFYRKPKATEAEGAWDYSLDDIENILKKYENQELTEVHITGGVHPFRDLNYWANIIKRVKEVRPNVHVKAYTAVEIAFMSRTEKCSFKEVLLVLKEAGLGSLPGGGAEIFNDKVRKKIAGGKAPSNHWLEIHQTAHELGLSSNATMLYGHIESLEDRLDHMIKIRDLQEKTNGFNSFIPLKYRNENNALSHMKELTEDDDLRNFAVSRLMMNNIQHLKAYWVMIGHDTAQKSLDYGVDDLDGTINDTTKIYSMAGSLKHPTLSEDQLKSMIINQGRTPVERNSTYEAIPS